MTVEIKNLQELLSQYVGPKKKVISSDISNLLASGENYMSVVLKVDVVLQDEETGKEEHISGVAKTIPASGEFDRRIEFGKMMYSSERKWYTDIVPTLENFVREKGFERNFDIFPKLIAYRANLHGENDEVDLDSILLMENLKVQGYDNIDRHVGFDYETVKLILEDIAMFHAVPLALKLKKRKVFDEKIMTHLIRPDFQPPKPKEGDQRPPPPPPEFAFDIWLEALESREGCKLYLSGLRNIFEFVKSNPGAMFGKMNVREPFATIRHSDLWVNNTMQVFEDGKLVKNKLVDFQMYTYGNPACDLLFFIWSSVQLSVIKEHFNDLINHYYDNFVGVLTELGCNVDAFSFDKFNEELKDATKLEFFHNIMFSKVIFMEKGKLAFDMNAKPGSQPPPTRESISEVVLDRVATILKICGKKGWI